MLMYVAAINLVVDIVLNLILMTIWGVAEIALSTSIVYTFSCLLLIACSARLLARPERSPVARTAATQRTH